MNEMQRGANIALTKENPLLSSVILGTQWEGPEQLQRRIQLAAILASNGKALGEEEIVFFNQMRTFNSAVLMDKDCEQLHITLSKVPAEVDSIDVIAWSNSNNDLLKQLTHLSMRVIDADTSTQLAETANCVEYLSNEKAVCIAQLYRLNGDWKFRAKGEGWSDGIAGAMRAYGIK